MTWYAWLALIALLFKGYWWFSSRRYTWADSRWYFLMAVLIIQNSSEFLGYNLVSLNISPESFAVPYFISIIAVPVAMYGFVRTQTRIENLVFSFMVVACVLMALLIHFTPYIVVGYLESSYPVQSIKGQYFYSYLVLGLSFFSVLVLSVIYNFRRATDPVERLNFAYAIKAFAPFVLVSVYVGGGLLLGLDVNGSGLFPVASSLFMLITIRYRCKHAYLLESDPRVLIPFSREWLLAKNIARFVFQFTIGHISLSSMLSNIEGEVLVYSYENHRGSKSALARKLGISRATLDRKMQRHNIAP